MYLEIIILSEVNQKEKQIQYDVIYMQNLKYDTDELIYETETDSQTQGRDLWLPRGSGWGGIDWEFEVSRYKPLCVEWQDSIVQQDPIVQHKI